MRAIVASSKESVMARCVLGGRDAWRARGDDLELWWRSFWGGTTVRAAGRILGRPLADGPRGIMKRLAAVGRIFVAILASLLTACTSHSDADAGDYTGLMSFDTAT